MAATKRVAALQIGVLGAARITPMALLTPSKLVNDVAVVAVAARDRGRAEAFGKKHGIARVHDSYAALFADPDVDAVYNPLPNSHHKRFTIEALRAGKHVLCEKPLAANADDARAMHDAACQSGKVLMEGFHWRYHPLAARVVDDIARLGRLQRVRASFCVPFLQPGDIRFDFALAGGALMDTGCYAVNIARTFAGVAATGPAGDGRSLVVDDATPVRTGKDGRVDRAFFARLHTDNADGSQTRVEVECSLMSSKLFSARAQIEGDNGFIDVWNPVAPQFLHLLRTKIDGRSTTTTVKGRSTYAHQLEAFRDAVLLGKPFLSTSADGIANMATIDALYTKAGLPLRVSAE